MTRTRSYACCAVAAVLLVAAVSTRAAAQRGSLSATITGHRMTPASDTLALRIAVQMTPGWHIGAEKPGVSGVPTALTWRLSVGWRVLRSQWPAPTPALVGRDTAFEYRGPFAIATALVTSGPRRSGPIEAVLSYGICREVCMPGQLTLAYEVR
jgi:DsbC/DsbD-like thiol-disulfide interchange protein